MGKYIFVPYFLFHPFSPSLSLQESTVQIEWPYVIIQLRASEEGVQYHYLVRLTERSTRHRVCFDWPIIQRKACGAVSIALESMLSMYKKGACYNAQNLMYRIAALYVYFAGYALCRVVPINSQQEHAHLIQ